MIFSVLLVTSLLFFYNYNTAYNIAYRALREEKQLIVKLTDNPLQYMVLKENFEKGLAEISEKYYLGKFYAGKEYYSQNIHPYAIINGIEYEHTLRAYTDYCYIITFIPWDHGSFPKQTAQHYYKQTRIVSLFSKHSMPTTSNKP